MSGAGSSARLLALFAAYGVAYYALSRLGLEYLESATAITPVWPASGLSLAAFVLAPRRRWPALAAVTLVANLAAQLDGRSLSWLALALAACNAAEPMLGALVMRRVAGADRFAPAASPRGLAGLAAASVVAVGVFAMVSAVFVALAGGDITTSLRAWWTSDAIGILLLTPVVLGLLTPSEDRCSPRESALLIGAAAIVAVVVFWDPLPVEAPLLEFPFIAFPALLAVALRLGPRPASVALLLVGAIALAATVRDVGPFADADLDDARQIAMLQGFLAILALCTLAATAVVASWRRAETAARRQHLEYLGTLRAATEFSIIGTETDGTITVFNTGAERMLGYRADEVIGRMTPEPLHDPEEVADRAAELGLEPGFDVFVCTTRDGQAETRDWTYIRKDGSRLTVSLTVTPKHDERGRLVGYIGIAQDMTAQRAAERARDDAEAQLRDAFEHGPVAMAILSPGGVIRDVNAALLDLSERPYDELIGMRPHDYTLPGDAQALREAIASVVAHPGTRLTVDVRAVRGTGEQHVVQAHVSTARDGRGRATQVLAHFLDVTERIEHEAHLTHLALHDSLTGLANRRQFEEALESHLGQAERYGACGAVLLLDIDHFKDVNDTHGHAAGDEVIIDVANVLRGRLRASDVLARLGGDEFAILLPRATAEEADVVAASLVRAVRDERLQVTDDGEPLTISVGAAVIERDDGLTAAALVAAADVAMYDAKRAGRDGYARRRGSSTAS